MFYVIEIQTNDETSGIIPYTFNNRDDAEEKYHDVLRVASKSEVKKHGCILMNDDGFKIKSEMYDRTE